MPSPLWDFMTGQNISLCATVLSLERKGSNQRKKEKLVHHRDVPWSNTLLSIHIEHKDALINHKMGMNLLEDESLNYLAFSTYYAKLSAATKICENYKYFLSVLAYKKRTIIRLIMNF